MKLTAKQEAFVDEYLIDLNATQAAIRAGYSKKTAQMIGFENLSKPVISAAIELAMKARSDRTEVTADRVLAEYAKLAFLDPRRFYNDKGALIPVYELHADVAAALSGMEVTVERAGKDEDGKQEFADVTKIKFADKKGALDSVARHLGMFIDRTEVTGKDGKPLETVTRIELVPMRGNSQA